MNLMDLNITALNNYTTITQMIGYMLGAILEYKIYVGSSSN